VCHSSPFVILYIEGGHPGRGMPDNRRVMKEAILLKSFTEYQRQRVMEK
jgi:hypothetical protein